MTTATRVSATPGSRSSTPCVLVIGLTGAGKSTAASMFAAALGCGWRDISDELIAEFAARTGLSEDRVRAEKDTYRDALYDLGCEIEHAEGPGALARRCLRSAGVVAGVRRLNEYAGCAHLFDAVAWIGGRGRRTPHDELEKTDAEWHLDNSDRSAASLKRLADQVDLVCDVLRRGLASKPARLAERLSRTGGAR